jgi:hypothetical protein
MISVRTLDSFSNRKPKDREKKPKNRSSQKDAFVTFFTDFTQKEKQG